MQDRRRSIDGPGDVCQRVAEFREDDHRLCESFQKTRERRQLGLPGRCGFRCGAQRGQETPFACPIAQADDRLPSRRLVGRVRLAQGVERQRELRGHIRLWLHGRQASRDRLLQGARARIRPLVEHGQREPHVATTIAALRANGPAELGQQCVHAPFVIAWLDEQTVHPSPGSRVNRIPGTPEDQQPVATAADGAQRPERAGVAVVRRRRQQDDVRGARSQRRDGFVPVALVGQAVRFVNNDDVPGTGGNRRKDFGTLDVVDR